ncbi:hypothetical protein UPYG_G00139800 [Umbra pygmaea]|uniref:Uncharacterized protein n=1 Tax=Umbra pygmaea TaxID=75934 RepID=A0ABD0XBG0_UMBPY
MKLAAKIKETQPLRPKILLWADVSFNDMKGIENTKSILELERILCCVMGVNFPEPKRGILLELYVHTLFFCRKSNFNREQTSALLSIVKHIHQANTETLLNNMDHCFAYCSELLLCHSVTRPPFSINLFSYEEVTSILKYLLNTYMRHYNLYKYIFTPQVRLDLSFSYSDMPDKVPVTEDVLSGDVKQQKEKELETAEVAEQHIETINPGPKLANAVIQRSISQIRPEDDHTTGNEGGDYAHVGSTTATTK